MPLFLAIAAANFFIAAVGGRSAEGPQRLLRADAHSSHDRPRELGCRALNDAAGEGRTMVAVPLGKKKDVS